jgi:hypothetical protein
VYEAGEIFHVDPETSRYPLKILKKERLGVEDLDVLLTQLAVSKQVDTIGFELFNRPQHTLSDGEAATLAARRDLHVVFLARKNFLKAFISWKRGMLTGLWHIDSSGHVIEHPGWNPRSDVLDQRIGAVDIEEARVWIGKNQEFLGHVEGKLRDLGKSYHKTCYEDLCLGNREGTVREVNRILRFLGLEELTSLEIKKTRIATKSFYRSIPNRQELIDSLGYDLE